ncbi:MAG: DUF366 family protein [Candidatus Hydrothermarchaeales archaeon]
METKTINSVSRIKIALIADRLDYTGHQIKPLWAFKELGIQGDSVVIFRGAMKVRRDELIDVKDYLREKDKEFPITSDDSLNFVIEHFDASDLRLTYHRQRLLIDMAKEKIERFGKIERKGSDLYHDGRKLTVSIATASVSSGKIHMGINITDKGVPDNVNAVGLNDLGVNDPIKLAEEIAIGYAEELKNIEDDITKSRVF